MNTQRVIVQVPMSKQLREQAQAAAQAQGFSSLQETIRVLLHKLAHKELAMTFADEKEEKLSARAISRYRKMIADIKAGRHITHTNSLEELLALLRS